MLRCTRLSGTDRMSSDSIDDAQLCGASGVRLCQVALPLRRMQTKKAHAKYVRTI